MLFSGTVLSSTAFAALPNPFAKLPNILFPTKKQQQQETLQARRNIQLQELRKKTDEMKQSFVVRIKEKEVVLKDTENEIHKRFEAIKKKNQEEKRRLEDERRQLDDEISNFQVRKNQVLSTVSTLQQGVTLQGKQKKKSLINIKE